MTNDEYLDYFKVWGDMLLKHPLTYIEAAMRNCYGFFIHRRDFRWQISKWE
ncbi:MAG: DUF6020 family protein [Bacteroidales bacterium]